MNLVKWFRKNNTKVMAVVVIVIMIGFIGGSSLSYFFRGGEGKYETVAYFGDGRKITNYDLALARRELEIFRMLRADGLVRSQDLRGVMLGELLFSEGKASPVLINRVKQAIRASRYRISDSQISDIYKRSLPNDVYWMLLRDEAELAGIRIPNRDAGRLLGQTIPQLFDGQTYSQIMGSVINRTGISEGQLLAMFGKLLSVLQYAQVVCSAQNVTSSQVRNLVSRENEIIDAEFVKFDSTMFAETQDQPSEEEMLEHFGKYKKFFAGDVNEKNPYGFGYKLPDRVQLEYIAVKLDDISSKVTAPTQEETEQYYQQNREELFTSEVSSDPNNPNSPMVKQIRSYAEVADVISDRLLRDRINSKAREILQEVKTLTDIQLGDIDVEDLNSARLKEMAGDYKIAAEQLSKKYEIKMYTGQTGLLGAVDMQADEYLGRLYVMGYGYNPVPLIQIVFSIDELGGSGLVTVGMQKPTMYGNIGPASDPLGQVAKRASGQIMAMVRVIKAEKASEPESISQTYSTRTFEFGQEQDDDGVYSIKEEIAEELKRFAALDTTKSKVDEFVGLVMKDGWDIAVEKFNELYRQQAGAEPDDDPNVFKLESLSGLRRISAKELETLSVQSSSNPTAWLFINEAKAKRQFIDQLYSSVPQDSNSIGDVPVIIEFKPNMGFYCLKSVSVKRLTQEEYENIKATRLYSEDHIQSQSLMAVHFNPENILQRMSFRLARKEAEATDGNVPLETEEAL